MDKMNGFIEVTSIEIDRVLIDGIEQETTVYNNCLININSIAKVERSSIYLNSIGNKKIHVKERYEEIKNLIHKAL